MTVYTDPEEIVNQIETIPLDNTISLETTRGETLTDLPVEARYERENDFLFETQLGGNVFIVIDYDGIISATVEREVDNKSQRERLGTIRRLTI